MAILAKLADERVRSSAIITITLNELCAELHNRMPVIPLGDGDITAAATGSPVD